MKRLPFALLLIILPAIGAAEVFQYKDDSGRVHFVTDPGRVPEQYKSQVQNAAALPEIGKVEMRKIETRSFPSRSTVSKTKKPVEVFVTSWCPHCKALESFLTENKIAFTKYDIETNEAGKKLYRSIDGTTGGVPVVRIGKLVIQGFNKQAILRALGS
jgi:glutaredoxin 3